MQALTFIARYALQLAIVWVGWMGASSAQVIGHVEFARGVGFAQAGAQAPRTLGKGMPVSQGDRISTAEGSFAILRLQDGTQMTVRPNSQLVLQTYQFEEKASNNNMVLQLLKGGLRAVTGLINKNGTGAASVVTATSTIGIRGTDFDARICTQDCKAEAARVPEKASANLVQASAKLVSAQGFVTVVDLAGQQRGITPGGSVYEGEQVQTSPGAQAVFVFRDESRVTVGGSTRFKVDRFSFDQQSPATGQFLVSLVRGSMRALTGLIGKVNSRNVGYVTPTSTIGIRGTGLDMDCSQEGSCSYFTWAGTIEVTPNGQSTAQILVAGQGLQVGAGELRFLPASTLENLPRPDGLTIDMQQFFLNGPLADGALGLYVFVRDGHIELVTGFETLQLGRGEAGYAGADGHVVRPTDMPQFLKFDTTPLPTSSNFELRGVLSDAGLRTAGVCP